MPVLRSVHAAQLCLTWCVALMARLTQIHAMPGARVLVLPVLVSVPVPTVSAQQCLTLCVALTARLTPTNARQCALGLRQIVQGSVLVLCHE